MKIKEVWNIVHRYFKPIEHAQVLEALQSEMVISSINQPIVATYGCSPCIAMGGYDPISKIAFVVHFAKALEVNPARELIQKELEKRGATSIHVHLRGGIKGISENTYKEIQELVKASSIPMSIVSEDVLVEKGQRGKSLMIDSRTGSVENYEATPSSRTMSEDKILSYLQNLENSSITLYENTSE